MAGDWYASSSIGNENSERKTATRPIILDKNKNYFFENQPQCTWQHIFICRNKNSPYICIIKCERHHYGRKHFWYCLSDSIRVVRQFLVLFVLVRIQVGQQTIEKACKSQAFSALYARLIIYRRVQIFLNLHFDF